MWAHLSAPQLRPLERLFFECYARGANGEAPFDQLLPGAVESWLADDGGDPALRRLGLAVVRGLLLDLVATGDEAATAAALARFADLVGRRRRVASGACRSCASTPDPTASPTSRTSTSSSRTAVRPAGSRRCGAARGVQFREVDGDYHIDFHNAPRRQLVVNLTGSVEIETGNGDRRLLGPARSCSPRTAPGRATSAAASAASHGPACSCHSTMSRTADRLRPPGDRGGVPMSSRKELVERYCEGFRRGDHAMVLGCLTDDVTWDLPGHTTLAGKEAFDGEIENPAFTGRPTLVVDRLVEEGDTVVAVGAGARRSRRRRTVHGSRSATCSRSPATASERVESYVVRCSAAET